MPTRTRRPSALLFRCYWATCAIASPVVLGCTTAGGAHAVEASRAPADEHTPKGSPAMDPPPTMDNPLLTESTLPYGFPDFEAIEDRHFEPAFERGMREEQTEVAAVAGQKAAPTFDNTVVALEKGGRLLARTESIFFDLVQSNTNPALDALQTKLAPLLAAHSDAIYLNAALFRRVQDLYQRRASLGLDAESEQLLTRYYTRFVRAGADLDDADKSRLRAINERLSTLTTAFQQAVLKGVNEAAVKVADPAELAGLSEAEIGAARQAAQKAVERVPDKAAAKSGTNAAARAGGYLLSLTNTTGQPLLARIENREPRRRIFEASITRGLPGGSSGEHATTALISEIVRLRAERAALLGYESHAAYVLADETAKTPDAVDDMLTRLSKPAADNARAEAAEIQKRVDADAKRRGVKPWPLEPWDWDYYAEQVRKARYDYDEAEVRPYFELNRVLKDGVLFAAEKLYGLRFAERSDLPPYHPDVRVFEVFDRDRALGLCLVDWFARDNKRGGAWMSELIGQSHLLERKAVVSTNLNVQKPPPGQPALMTFDEVDTAFHEFGHALHGLLSDVRYPSLAGTAVPTDFAEYPSQQNEMWATDPSVLANYAKHYETGAPMPRALLDRVLSARKWNQGYRTTEYLAAALLDQAYHRLSPDAVPAPDAIESFEERALQRAGLRLRMVPPRYRSGYFSHIFADPMGYSAGYYAYIWSEVLARDTEHWFKTHGGLRRDSGDTYREHILSRGFSEDPMAMFERFKGGPPDIEPLLEAKGLAPAQP